MRSIILIKLKMNIVVKKLNTPIRFITRSHKKYLTLSLKSDVNCSSWLMRPFTKFSSKAISAKIGDHMSSKKIAFGFSSNFDGPKYRQQVKIPVHEFLNAHQLAYMEGPNVYKIKYCPFCEKPHHDDKTNLYVLNVHKDFGYYHCFRCSSKGNWLQFRQKILGIDTEFAASSFFQQRKPAQNSNQRISETEYFFFKENLHKQSFEDVLDYIKSRGFTEDTIKKYNLGAGAEDFFDEGGEAHYIKLVYFPLYKLKETKDMKADVLKDANEPFDKNFYFNNQWSQIAKVKMRGASKETKKYMRQYPIGSARGIFGLNLVKDTDKTVVLTEGEFDAMAVYQQTGLPAVSLPQGASNLPESLLTIFDKFDKIILWMDNDQAGILNTAKIAQKLGLKRTYIVKHMISNMKDANDFLKHHPSMMKDLINNARTIPESNITRFSRIRDVIKAKLMNQELQQGLKISWLPFFNQKVKGVRLGQLTVISGPTGSGKTTFLSQLFLDLCQRDIGVLWGSFQIRNEVLISHMMNQFANISIAKNIEKFDFYAQKFQKLPLYLMNFHGSTTPEKILSTIVYTIEKHNVHMVVLDTLQFMLSQQGEGFRKFQIQDSLMAKLRQISIKFNVHIAIVIHPRKTEDTEDIGIHSIYGTSKATQEADNIWIIQNRDGFKILDVKKNRYDGELGKIPLGFNRDSKRFFQLKRAEFEAIRTKEMTMREVIKAREEEDSQRKPISEEEYHLFEQQIKDHELTKAPKTFNSNYSRN